MESRNHSNPHLRIKENIVFELDNLGVSESLKMELVKEIPSRWEKLGDMVIFPQGTDTTNWPMEEVAEILQANRIGIQNEIDSGPTRKSQLELVHGGDGWVVHRENFVEYEFDATQVMFSSGNVTERRRMGEIARENEIVVDLFCGIGYYTLPILVKNKIKHVYSCEWNDNAIKALKFNLENNNVSKKCTIIEGDNRLTTKELTDKADRVLLGLLPTSEGSYQVALSCLKPKGGVLHIHGLSPSNDYQRFVTETCKKLLDINAKYKITDIQINKIKSYAPHWDHLVLDIEIGKK